MPGSASSRTSPFEDFSLKHLKVGEELRPLRSPTQYWSIRDNYIKIHNRNDFDERKQRLGWSVVETFRGKWIRPDGASINLVIVSWHIPNGGWRGYECYSTSSNLLSSRLATVEEVAEPR